MKNILIPIDFSDNAMNALGYATKLFEASQCTFILLNVYVSQASNMLSEERNEAILNVMDDESEIELKKIFDSVVEANNNGLHTFKMVSKSGKIAPIINSMVASGSIDFVVMATKGAKGAREVFLGSNAVRVINGVDKCPIIVVPQNYQVRKPKMIAFSTNFKRTFYQEELRTLIDILKNQNAKLNVARVMIDDAMNDKQKNNREKLKKILEDIDHIFYKIDIESTETKALKDFAQQTDCDMIALIHHKFSLFQKLLEEDVVDKISFSSPIPLLILPELY
ncbi:universal stress protein [Aquimarina gracilis]|uniref:Universal stress protein n=1 Tax=Aquimarina gracilis TaxID=874422 RepID=A0ABU5ZVT7_9FLAO|nr:universal stress protein [Aquimarina gracilis]MEB3345987.1 universal stress protein [Aquimarina gracilis]